jgi:HEAT repeat protein
MRHARRLLYCCLLPAALGAAGCANFWDEVTSRDFKFKDLYTKAPPPLVVLKDSDDGYARAKALAALQEPLQHGGTQKEQDLYVDILSKSATSARDPLCRMAAIQSLGHFKDPRAADVLCSVTEQNLTFTSEANNMIRLKALEALAKTGQPVAVRRLIQVAKEPPAEGSAQDRQEVLDRRLTAIRGLGKYNYPESNDTLVSILANDKDAAVRKRAHDSLVSATGKDLPPKADEWAQYLHPETRRPGEAVARQQQPQQSPGGFWDYVTYPIRLVRGQ